VWKPEYIPTRFYTAAIGDARGCFNNRFSHFKAKLVKTECIDAISYSVTADTTHQFACNWHSLGPIFQV
jgi:hypothetical protein